MRKQETSDEWLARQFATSYCGNCGGDAQHHHPILVMNTFYARCDYPRAIDGAIDPVIVKYRAERGDPVDGTCQHGNFPGYCAACAGEE